MAQNLGLLLCCKTGIQAGLLTGNVANVTLSVCVPLPTQHLGAMEVSEAKGSGVVRDAVDRLKLVAEVKRSDGMLLPEVDICICIRNVTIMDVQSKVYNVCP